MFRRRRFGELVDRQLDLFARENADALGRIEQMRRRELEADADDATEAFGDYLDEVGWAAEELRALRDTYSGTLEPDAGRDYAQAYAKAVRRRFPALHDAFAHDDDLSGSLEDDED
jgi:hypothetical protein